MKRAIGIVFALSLLVSGAWAGGQKETPKTAPAAKKIELDFPSWQAEEPGFADFWKEAIAAFKTQNPNVDIKLTQITFKDYVDLLTTRFAAGNAPDVLHLPARNFAQFAAQGWLEPLDERLKEADIPANWTALQSAITYKGKNVGLLLMGYGFLLFYNEKMLQDAGLTLPKSPEEMVAAAKKLTNEKTGQFGMGITTTEHPNVYNDVTNIVYGLGLSLFKNGQYNYTDPEVVKAVDQFRQLAACSPKGTTTEMKRQLFIDGKIAMMMDGPFVTAMFAKANEALKPSLKIALLPYPAVPGQPSNSMHIPASLTPEKKDLVWKFIKTLAAPDFQAKYTVFTKSPAGRKNVLTPELAKQYPSLLVINKSAETAVNTWPDSQNVMSNYAQYGKIVASAMLRLMATSEPTQKVLEDLQTALNREIKP